MSDYKAPGVYFERADSISRSIQGRESDIFGFVGVTPRGVVDTPVLVKSWNDYIDKFAGGLSSPFLANHDLSYAMYGFFQNGGKKAYVSRVMGGVTTDPNEYGISKLHLATTSSGYDGTVVTVKEDAIVSEVKLAAGISGKNTCHIVGATFKPVNSTQLTVEGDLEIGNTASAGDDATNLNGAGIAVYCATGNNDLICSAVQYLNVLHLRVKGVDTVDTSISCPNNTRIHVQMVITDTSVEFNFTGSGVGTKTKTITSTGILTGNTAELFAGLVGQTRTTSSFTNSLSNFKVVNNNGNMLLNPDLTPIPTYTAASATLRAGSSDESIVEAKDLGAWGNKLKVSVATNAIDSDLFDITVSLGGSIKETFSGLSNDSADTNYAYDVINGQSAYIRFPDESKFALRSEDIYEFSGGRSDDNFITDDSYIDALNRMKQVDELGFLCVPGISTYRVIEALKLYVEDPKVYTVGIVDVPKGTTTKELALEFRKTVVSDDMAVIEPYGYVVDPLSPSGRLRLVPPSGHWCGYEAKNIATNGIQEAPAGTDSAISGFVKLEVNYTMDDLEFLNPAGIITLVDKKNYGIVIWGCRSCSSNADYRYITDKLVDNYIDGSIDAGTQYAVFRSNDEDLWDDLTTTVTEFLEGCRQQGIIKGTTPAKSYFVNCNEDVNTEAVQKAGKVICEYGFAKKKPAEFVIHRVNHNMSSSTSAE